MTLKLCIIQTLLCVMCKDIVYISFVYQKVITKEMYNTLSYIVTLVILGSIRPPRGLTQNSYEQTIIKLQ